MSHEFYSGAMAKSSWHRLEKIAEMPDARSMIKLGESTGAWPTELALEPMTTESGLVVPGQCIVADYADGSRKAHKAVSDGYRYLDPKEWRATIEAAVAAGAKPAGAFALGAQGGKLIATFEIDGSGRGSGAFRNFLNLFDSVDQSTSFGAGGSSIRVVCANTFAAFVGRDGSKAARIRHTKSINDRAEMLREAIEGHIEDGNAIAELYEQARGTEIHADEMMGLIAQLFPVPAEDKASKAAITRAQRRQVDAGRAMTLAVNDEGPTVASVWNAATFLVDRDGDGEFRSTRGPADPLESMMFGSRGKRVEEVRQAMVKVLRPDGSEDEVTAPEAASMGVDARQIGRSILGDMLN